MSPVDWPDLPSWSLGWLLDGDGGGLPSGCWTRRLRSSRRVGCGWTDRSSSSSFLVFHGGWVVKIEDRSSSLYVLMKAEIEVVDDHGD